MKNVFKITVCFMLLVSMLAFAACNNGGEDKGTSKDEASQGVTSGELSSADESTEEANPIVGTWYAPGYTIMFKDDGTGVYGKTDALAPITWEVADGKLTVKYDNDTVHENEEYTVAEDGTTLTVGDTVYSNEPAQIAENIDVDLIGSWYNYSSAGEGCLILNADGTGAMTAMGMEVPATWSVVDGVLSLNIDMGDSMGSEMKADSYKVEGDTLTVTMMGMDSVYTKERRELGGDAQLAGTWIEPDAAEDEYAYSITFGSDGTGDYTVTETFDVYSFLWTEKDGTISFEVYTIDYETFEESVLGVYESTYTIDDEKTTLTLKGVGEDATEKTFAFYEEEESLGDLFGGVEVDTEHELGGDEALVGEWLAGTGEDEATVNITADGKFIMGDDEFEMELSWYTEDGYLMAYTETLGVATAIIYGEYTVENDIIAIVVDGEYTEMTRKGSGKAGCNIMVMGIDKEDVTENDAGFSEGSVNECVKFYIEGAVKDLKYAKYVYEGRDVGDFVNCIGLSAVTELAEDGSFVVGSTFKFDMLSDGYEDARGISFTNSNGDTVYLAVIYNEDTETYGFYKINDPIWVE